MGGEIQSWCFIGVQLMQILTSIGNCNDKLKILARKYYKTLELRDCFKFCLRKQPESARVQSDIIV